MKIPFNKPTLVGNEIQYVHEAFNNMHISGDGIFTKRCNAFFQNTFNAFKVLLTTSCTHALEMSSILIDIKPGDEIIVPSFTFVSTINSFVLRGAKPVFVDIREDTLNIDEKKIEEKITSKTKAIYLVHYAGVSCELDSIMDITKKYNLFIVEDAAQAVNSKYKGKYLGTIGDFGAYSFHETKNLYCGEGGALIINNKDFIERSEIIREKGTNRSKFFRGEVDKYTWVDIGSSYLPSDILAAFLYAQLEKFEDITTKRKILYDAYYQKLLKLQSEGLLQLPSIPDQCTPNYHIFYILLKSEEIRDELMLYLKSKGILAVFHYIPLHNSPMGKRFSFKEGDLPITESISKRILRLPLYYSMQCNEQDYVVEKIYEYFNTL